MSKGVALAQSSPACGRFSHLPSSTRGTAAGTLQYSSSGHMLGMAILQVSPLPTFAVQLASIAPSAPTPSMAQLKSVSQKSLALMSQVAPEPALNTSAKASQLPGVPASSSAPLQNKPGAHSGS